MVPDSQPVDRTVEGLSGLVCVQDKTLLQESITKCLSNQSFGQAASLCCSQSWVLEGSAAHRAVCLSQTTSLQPYSTALTPYGGHKDDMQTQYYQKNETSTLKHQVCFSANMPFCFFSIHAFVYLKLGTLIDSWKFKTILKQSFLLL